MKKTRKKKPAAAIDGRSRETVKKLAQVCHDKKGIDLAILNLRKLASFTDYFLVCSGSSDRHVKALADGVEETAKKNHIKRFGAEGYEKGQWVLLDFGDVVAHLFQPETREFYDLEGLWRDAPRVHFKFT